MKVLVLESERGAAQPMAEKFAERGHTVLGCDSHLAAGATACRGLDVGGACPLDADDVAVAVVVHAGADIAPSEHGALCATRQRIPLVVVGDEVAHPFGASVWAAGASPSMEDLVATCEAAASDGRPHAAAVRHDLMALGLMGDDDGVDIHVERQHRRLVLSIIIATDHPRRAAIVKAAAEALRRFDRTTAVIDVRVVH